MNLDELKELERQIDLRSMRLSAIKSLQAECSKIAEANYIESDNQKPGLVAYKLYDRGLQYRGAELQQAFDAALIKYIPFIAAEIRMALEAEKTAKRNELLMLKNQLASYLPDMKEDEEKEKNG